MCDAPRGPFLSVRQLSAASLRAGRKNLGEVQTHLDLLGHRTTDDWEGNGAGKDTDMKTGALPGPGGNQEEATQPIHQWLTGHRLPNVHLSWKTRCTEGEAERYSRGGVFAQRPGQLWWALFNCLTMFMKTHIHLTCSVLSLCCSHFPTTVILLVSSPHPLTPPMGGNSLLILY